MCCSSCKYLDLKDKKEGRVSGCCYFCQLRREYVRASDSECSSFLKDEKIGRDVKDKVEKEGKEYYDDITPVSFYGGLLIFLIVLGIIMGVF